MRFQVSPSRPTSGGRACRHAVGSPRYRLLSPVLRWHLWPMEWSSALALLAGLPLAGLGGMVTRRLPEPTRVFLLDFRRARHRRTLAKLTPPRPAPPARSWSARSGAACGALAQHVRVRRPGSSAPSPPGARPGHRPRARSASPPVVGSLVRSPAERPGGRQSPGSVGTWSWSRHRPPNPGLFGCEPDGRGGPAGRQPPDSSPLTTRWTRLLGELRDHGGARASRLRGARGRLPAGRPAGLRPDRLVAAGSRGGYPGDRNAPAPARSSRLAVIWRVGSGRASSARPVLIDRIATAAAGPLPGHLGDLDRRGAPIRHAAEPGRGEQPGVARHPDTPAQPRCARPG